VIKENKSIFQFSFQIFHLSSPNRKDRLEADLSALRSGGTSALSKQRRLNTSGDDKWEM